MRHRYTRYRAARGPRAAESSPPEPASTSAAGVEADSTIGAKPAAPKTTEKWTDRIKLSHAVMMLAAALLTSPLWAVKQETQPPPRDSTERVIWPVPWPIPWPVLSAAPPVAPPAASPPVASPVRSPVPSSPPSSRQSPAMVNVTQETAACPASGPQHVGRIWQEAESLYRDEYYQRALERYECAFELAPAHAKGRVDQKAVRTVFRELDESVSKAAVRAGRVRQMLIPVRTALEERP